MPRTPEPPRYGRKRINVSVSFDVPSDATEREVTMILADAIGEFFGHRYPAKEYVDRRYPDTEAYSWLNREAKVESTNRRLEICQTMRETVDGWHVKEELEEPSFPSKKSYKIGDRFRHNDGKTYEIVGHYAMSFRTREVDPSTGAMFGGYYSMIPEFSEEG